MNSTIIVRYQINDPSTCNTIELLDLLKQTYGGALNFVADGTILIDTFDNPDDVFNLISSFFSFDDKLLVGAVGECRSIHHIPRTKPSIRRIAV